MHDIAEIDAPFAPLKPDEIVPVAAPVSDGELVLPVPADAPPIPETHFALGQPSARWTYRDAAGAVLFEVLRFDKSDGGKEFWPLTLGAMRKVFAGAGSRFRTAPALQSRQASHSARRAGGGLRGREIGRCGVADFPEVGGGDFARWRERGRQGGLERASRA